MNATVQEEGTKPAVKPVTLDVRQMGMLLTVATQRANGLRLKVSKFGPCYVSGHYVEIKNEKITVHRKDGRLVLESYDEENGVIRQFKPANNSAEAKFMEWVHEADSYHRESVNFGNPVEIAFDC